MNIISHLHVPEDIDLFSVPVILPFFGSGYFDLANVIQINPHTFKYQ